MNPRIGVGARQRALAVLMMIAMLGAGCGGPPGPETRSASGPQRIVSLAPAITETLFAVGAGPAVVGVSNYCSYPPAAAALPHIGSFLTPNVEAIAALQPTIVIVPQTSANVREVHALKAMGYRTLMVDEDSIAGIEASIRRIGEATGHPREAQALLERMDQRFAAIERRLRAAPRRRVLMVVGHQPMVAVGPGTYLNELLEMARATNIASAAAQAWPRLSLEYIIAAQPQVILDGQMGTDQVSPASFWASYRMIPAVRDRRVTGYPEDPTLHPGPRIGQTLELLARRIHPESFAAETGQ